jgi:hemerythrin-like domain-containing protein
MADRAIEEHLKVKVRQRAVCAIGVCCAHAHLSLLRQKELDALDKMEVTESKFVPAVEKMSKDLDQHIKEEESEIFPILKQKYVSALQAHHST